MKSRIVTISAFLGLPKALESQYRYVFLNVIRSPVLTEGFDWVTHWLRGSRLLLSDYIRAGLSLPSTLSFAITSKKGCSRLIDIFPDNGLDNRTIVLNSALCGLN